MIRCLDSTSNVERQASQFDSNGMISWRHVREALPDRLSTDTDTPGSRERKRVLGRDANAKNAYLLSTLLPIIAESNSFHRESPPPAGIRPVKTADWEIIGVNLFESNVQWIQISALWCNYRAHASGNYRICVRPAARAPAQYLLYV